MIAFSVSCDIAGCDSHEARMRVWTATCDAPTGTFVRLRVDRFVPLGIADFFRPDLAFDITADRYSHLAEWRDQIEEVAA